MQNIPAKLLKLFTIVFLLLGMVFTLDEVQPWQVIAAAVPLVLLVVAFGVYDYRSNQRLEREHRARMARALEDLARAPDSYRVHPDMPARPRADLVDHLLTALLVAVLLYQLVSRTLT